MELKIAPQKKADESSLWGLLTGTFRTAAIVESMTGQETRPARNEEIVEDEALRQLARAGIPGEAYELKAIPAARHHGSVSENPDDWVIYIRVLRWMDGMHWVVALLERQLAQELHRAGLNVRAVYWRTIPEDVREFRPPQP